MEKIIYGKTEGIKKNILDRLESLYDMTVEQGPPLAARSLFM